MQIIIGDKSYSKKIIQKNLIEKYFLIGSLFLFAVIYFIFFISKAKIPNPESFVILFSMILGMLIALFYIWMFRKLDKILNKKDNNINKARAGEAGELAVLNKLKTILDNNYFVFRNFKIPGRKFDVDFLIIGPKGLIVMEVKNSSSCFTFSEIEALRIMGAGFTQEVTKLMGNADPRIKLKNHCKSLNYYLYSIGLKELRAKKVLVFVNGSISIEGKAVIYIVKKLEELTLYFSGLNDDKRFSSEYCLIIVEKLKNSLEKSK
jgi:hypothetical protein